MMMCLRWLIKRTHRKQSTFGQNLQVPNTLVYIGRYNQPADNFFLVFNRNLPVNGFFYPAICGIDLI